MACETARRPCKVGVGEAGGRRACAQQLLSATGGMVSLAEKGDKEPVTPALDIKCVWSMTGLEGLDRQRVFPPHPQPFSSPSHAFIRLMYGDMVFGCLHAAGHQADGWEFCSPLERSFSHNF